jgi:hypothetical protein
VLAAAGVELACPVRGSLARVVSVGFMSGYPATAIGHVLAEWFD